MEDRLLQLYDHWRVLTEGERDAIRTSDWSRVGDLQAQKQQLQEEIMAVTEAAGDPASAPGVGLDVPRRVLGAQLIALEQQNASVLADQRRGLEQHQRVLDQTRRTLQQVHRAYTQGKDPAWQSYS